jgi:hypothetical protein
MNFDPNILKVGAAICIIVIGVVIYKKYYTSPSVKTVLENYKDPLWMQPRKMYRDYYPRANGSIYGTPERGWNMFSGLNSNTKV